MEIPSQPTPFTVFSLKYENRETAGKSGEYSTKKKGGLFFRLYSRLPYLDRKFPAGILHLFFLLKFIYEAACVLWKLEPIATRP